MSGNQSIKSKSCRKKLDNETHNTTNPKIKDFFDKNQEFLEDLDENDLMQLLSMMRERNKPSRDVLNKLSEENPKSPTRTIHNGKSDKSNIHNAHSKPRDIDVIGGMKPQPGDIDIVESNEYYNHKVKPKIGDIDIAEPTIGDIDIVESRESYNDKAEYIIGDIDIAD